ncbi:MAG: type II secretion system protein GspL [Sedimenticola sp.]
MPVTDSAWITPLDGNEGHYRWYLPQPESCGEEGRGSLTELTEKHPGIRRLNLLAPSEDVSLFKLNIPNRNRTVLDKALPFALEERLAEDVEELHVTVLHREAPDTVYAAVIKKSLMKRWIEDAGESGLTLNRIVPEVLALPQTDQAWHLVTDENISMIRTGPWSGITIDRTQIQSLKGRITEISEEKPDRLICWLPAPDSLEILSEIQQVNQAYEGALFYKIMTDGELNSAINLLQGEYARRSDSGWSPRRFLPAAAVLASALVLHLGFNLYEISRLSSQIESQKASVEQRFRALFPEINRIVDIEVQSRQALEKLKAGAGVAERGQFFQLLGLAGRTINSRPDVQITSLSYDNGVLQLQISTKELVQLDTIRTEIEKHRDISVELVSATSNEQGVSGRLRISTSQS